MNRLVELSPCHGARVPAGNLFACSFYQALKADLLLRRIFIYDFGTRAAFERSSTHRE
jgi:hypothetical protein